MAYPYAEADADTHAHSNAYPYSNTDAGPAEGLQQYQRELGLHHNCAAGMDGQARKQ